MDFHVRKSHKGLFKKCYQEVSQKSVFDVLRNCMKTSLRKYIFKIPSNVFLMELVKISRNLFLKYCSPAVQMFFLLVFYLFGTFLQKKQIKIEI